MSSLLQRAQQADIVAQPFPHLVIDNALPRGEYERLAADFPADDIVLNGRTTESNRNYRYAATDVLQDKRISEPWREFVRYHVSTEFWQEMVQLFGTHLRRLHPHLEPTIGKSLPEWKTQVRFREPPGDVALECQFAHGTPVTATSRVIGPHVDREVAIYAGLFYLRDPADSSLGGDLELYRFVDQPRFNAQRRVDDECVQCFRTIPYAANTLVILLHCHLSLHGVSPRGVTEFPRRHVNLVAEIPQRVFDLRPYTPIRQHS